MCPCLGGLVLVAVKYLVGGVTPNSLVMLTATRWPCQRYSFWSAFVCCRTDTLTVLPDPHRESFRAEQTHTSAVVLTMRGRFAFEPQFEDFFLALDGFGRNFSPVHMGAVLTALRQEDVARYSATASPESTSLTRFIGVDLKMRHAPTCDTLLQERSRLTATRTRLWRGRVHA